MKKLILIAAVILMVIEGAAQDRTFRGNLTITDTLRSDVFEGGNVRVGSTGTVIDSIVHDSMYLQMYENGNVNTILTQSDDHSRLPFGTGNRRYWISETGSDVTGDGTYANPWGTLDAVRFAPRNIDLTIFNLDFDTVSLWNIVRTIKEYDLAYNVQFSGNRHDTLDMLELTRIDEYSMKSTDALVSHALDSGYFLTRVGVDGVWSDTVKIGQLPILRNLNDTVYLPCAFPLGLGHKCIMS